MLWTDLAMGTNTSALPDHSGADTIIFLSGTLSRGRSNRPAAAGFCYRSVDRDREVDESIDAVLQIEAAVQEAVGLTAAEQAYAKGKWAEAVSGKVPDPVLSVPTAADWVRVSQKILRLIDSAHSCGQFWRPRRLLGSSNWPRWTPKTLKRGRRSRARSMMRRTWRWRSRKSTPPWPLPNRRRRSCSFTFLAGLYAANDEPALAAECRKQLKKLWPTALFTDNGDATRIIFACERMLDGEQGAPLLKNERRERPSRVLEHNGQVFQHPLFSPDCDRCYAFDKAHSSSPRARRPKRDVFKFLDDVTFGRQTSRSRPWPDAGIPATSAAHLPS